MRLDDWEKCPEYEKKVDDIPRHAQHEKMEVLKITLTLTGSEKKLFRILVHDINTPITETYGRHSIWKRTM